MSPKDFDIKFNELQQIERRMEAYNAKTPISKVTADHEKAKRIYRLLATALNKYKLTTVQS